MNLYTSTVHRSLLFSTPHKKVPGPKVPTNVADVLARDRAGIGQHSIIEPVGRGYCDPPTSWMLHYAAVAQLVVSPSQVVCEYARFVSPHW